ncbi:MAG TPA: cache domain-containing protein [Fibrobacteraceae bacterium]|nr:cache domain-containing protein [Fibrobacteraceae bacterium]
MRKLLAFFLLSVLSPTFGAAESEPVTEFRVIGQVRMAVVAMQKDAPGTLAKINAGSSPFVDKENPTLYVFVYDTAVNLVAHPRREMQGKNLHGHADVRGLDFRDEIVHKALVRGEGWTDYYYPKPGAQGFFRKSSYCERVIGSDERVYIVVSGLYR